MSKPSRNHLFLARMLNAWTTGARRWLRVAAYVACVFVMLAAASIASAKSSVSEAALATGRQLAGFEDLMGYGANRVLLNGEVVNVATADSDQDLEQVLDRFETHCRRNDPGSDLFQNPTALSSASVQRDSSPGVLRRQGPRDGMVACLVSQQDSAPTLAGRLERFGETLNLSDVGHLRYAYAKRTAKGKTHVLTAWTRGNFSLKSFIGEANHDAPGTDTPGAARPRNSVRLLSAEVEGLPVATRVYQAPGEPSTLLKHYSADMVALGWTPIRGLQKNLPDGLAFSKAGTTIMVFAATNESGTALSIVQSRSGNR